MTLDLSRSALDESVDVFARERRSIRSFLPDPIPRTVVTELLELACWAPSPHNAQPWRFTALFDEVDRQRLATAMAERLEQELRADGLSEDEVQRQSGRSRSRISAAPVAILCSLVPEGLVSYADNRMAGLEWEMAVQSVGAVLQTLFLLAHARGIGTCWMAAPMYCPDVVRATLELPDDYAPQALVLMGYAARRSMARARRPGREVIDLR